jgi:hypothetical protein
MNPRNTYTSGVSALMGQQSSIGNKKKKPIWGIPKSNSFPSVGIGNTAQTTNAYPKSVNSPNPTAGNITPSAPGATGTQQGSNAPATSAPGGSSLPPAGQDYASKLAAITQSAGNLQTAFDSYKDNQKKTTTEDKDTGKKDESEYLKYLRSQFNPDEAKRAQENVNALNERIAKEVERERTEQERIQKNEAGMIERGQTHLSTDAARESSKALADLAIAKGYSTDILDQHLAAGRTLQEAEEAARKEAESPLTIEEAQSLGLPFGTTMAEARLAGVVPTEGGGGASGVASMAQMVMSGEMDIANVPTDLRGAVADAVAAGGGIVDPASQMSSYQKERITRNLNSIADLKTQVSGWNTGMGSLISVIPGTPAANFKADVNTLSANIAFGELTAMREASKTGGALGQVSERELALLEAALGSLDRAQSPDQFLESLQTIEDSIARWQAAVNEHGGGEGGEGDFDW